MKPQKSKVIVRQPLGTVAQQAAYDLVEKVCPDQTAATCLALLVSGNKDVVGLIRENLCIALDGCGKLCAKKATEEYSGKVDDAVVIDEILKEMGEKPPSSQRDFTEKDWDLAHKIAEIIAQRVDLILKNAKTEDITAGARNAVQVPLCSCMSSDRFR